MKCYLNTSALRNGIPAQIIVYRNENASQMSLSAEDIAGPRFMMPLQIFHEDGAHFIHCPVDPAEVAGLGGFLR